ncbi:MAG TPA: radical SAM protein [Candidatus Acidoferrales bacterium]|nr:radical SAM protein [Candidatus Acidoferrales bacterium]
MPDPAPPPAWPQELQTAFGVPRHPLGNRFVYAVISSRAGGLSLGVNLNPNGHCNFDCPYCEVDRGRLSANAQLDIRAMTDELERTLLALRLGILQRPPWFESLAPSLRELRQVALSGDGEPTLAPDFVGAVEAVVGVRARDRFFKLALLTNGTELHRLAVARGLALFTPADEIWIKLDGGSQKYLETVNRPEVPLEKILENILLIARQRPVVIQSLFPSVRGEKPPEPEIQAYAARLCELVAAGAQIAQVQIYTATRPRVRRDWGPLPSRVLSQIGQTVRQATKLRVEVY